MGIVNVNVSQQVASAPNLLQQTGCILSSGGTTLTAGIPYFLSQVSDFTAISTGPGQTQYKINDFFAQSQTASAFPGSTALAAGGQGVYVMELGTAGTNAEVAALAAYIAAPQPASNTGNPQPVVFYAYLVPDQWDQSANFIALASSHASTTSTLYFYIQTEFPTGSPLAGGWIPYEGIKSIFAILKSPLAPTTEESSSAFFYVALNYAPSSVNLVAPMEYRYLYGVTPYVLTPANQISAGAAGVNWVSTGAAGGISNALIATGEFMDKNPFNYWYAIDWLVVQEILALSAAIINGSNSPTNPLYYNQAGINTLQKVAQGVVNRGISFGMILGPATVTAVDFNTYVTENPSDYSTGTYNGLAVTFTPARGFASITINLTATNIPT
jgi:hypothetical protein